MTGNKISRTNYIALAVSGLLVFFLVWIIISARGVVPPFFLPTPMKVFQAIVNLAKQGTLSRDVGISLFRIGIGTLLSVIISLPLGMALGMSKKLEAFTESFIAFIRYIPPSAFIPLTIIWFGIGESSKITLIFLGVAPYLTLLIADIITGLHPELTEAALTLGASKQQVLFKVILPAAMPGIWNAIRLMVGAAWTFVIIAEIIGATSGVGHLMIESQRFLRTDNIFAAIVIIGLLGIITDYFFKITYYLMFGWTDKSARQ